MSSETTPGIVKKKPWLRDWFYLGTRGGEPPEEMPWIFYMTHLFVDLCVATIEQVIAAFGKFAKDKLSVVR